MRLTNQHVWNIVFVILFLILLGVGMRLIEDFGYRPLYSVGGADILLITLATFRVIRLFVYDKITGFIRDQFYDYVPVEGGEVMMKPEKGPRRTLADLIGCPWCFGLWAAASVTFFYFLSPYTFYLVLFLAIAAVATFLQLLTNMVGWKAEQLKKEVENL